MPFVKIVSSKVHISSSDTPKIIIVCYTLPGLWHDEYSTGLTQLIGIRYDALAEFTGRFANSPREVPESQDNQMGAFQMF